MISQPPPTPPTDVLWGQNRYGRYCVPRASAHRSAAKAVLAGKVREAETIQLIASRARPYPSVIVHAGTYFGDFLPALSKMKSVVLAFEPNKLSWSCALQTLHVNEIRNVVLLNLALGNADCEASLCTTETVRGVEFDLGGGSFITLAGGDQPCHIVMLDQLLCDHDDVSVIHLDVEGYETDALDGAMKTISRCCPLIIVETVPSPIWIKHSLEPLGYQQVGTVDRNTFFEVSPPRPRTRS